MTPEQINRVFGRGRLQMLTGAHVEVFREAAAPGESRRYTKRFLTTAECDYAQWTEREWRILARLIGHGTRCVPDVVQYDRGAHGTKLVQTYDAGATVDQWATLLPVERDGVVYTRVFDDCAHWWALAHQCLVALDEIHTIGLVHLDVKGDNICIPIGPSDFDPVSPGRTLFPVFHKLALIDFAFSLVCGESLAIPLPIGWQQDYDYQSPLLLRALETGRTGDLGPTENLDWRCDMYSLAAMLKRYLPREDQLCRADVACGWSADRYHAAKALILRIRDAHDQPLPARRPHPDLIAQTSEQLRGDELAQSLERGWSLARDAQPAAVPALPLTPVTRLAPPTRIVIPAREDLIAVRRSGRKRESDDSTLDGRSKRRGVVALIATAAAIAAIGIAGVLAYDPGWIADAAQRVADTSSAAQSALRRLARLDSSADDSALPATASDAAGKSTAVVAASEANEDPVAGVEHANVSANEDPAHEPSTSSQASGASADASVAASVPEAPAASTERSPPAEQSVSRATSSATSAAVEAPDRSRARPPQKAVHPARAMRGPGPTKPPAASAQRTRPADTRPSQLAGASKSKSAMNVARANMLRAAPSVAKRPGNDANAAIQRAPRSTAATMSASATTPQGTPAATATAPQAMTVAPATTVAQTVDSVAAAPNSATLQSPPTVSASGAPQAPPETQVSPVPPSPLAPSVQKVVTAPEPSRAPAASMSIVAPAPTPPATTRIAAAAPMAPVVELSRPLATPAFPPPSSPIAPEPARTRPQLEESDDLLAQAHWSLANLVPRTAERARLRIARAMYIAANANHPSQERFVVDAVVLTGGAADVRVVPREIAGAEARRLHEDAMRAYASRRVAADAIDLELRAFGANPYDPEIAGQLALFYLKTSPPQPERARDLALHAIGTTSAVNPRGRFDDWMTFAIASALTGRQADSTNALYVSVALARNDERVCRAALGALSTHGERMREPVESLLYRLHSQRRDDDSPSCAWPRSRLAGSPHPW